MIGIYKITNKTNGKVYIGQSQNCEKRISEHKRKKKLTIDDWINLLGSDAFTYEILEECSLEELDNKEKEYIKKYNSIEEGYNIQEGGFNNSIGEGNGRAKLTEEDVIKIRKSYASHESPRKVYEQFQNKIGYKSFQSVWQGICWKHIMPEVFTEENKKYYTCQISKEKSLLTKEEVLRYRQYYVNHTSKETYLLMCKEKGGKYLKERTFEKILVGDIRENSLYKDIPIYKKSQKKWINNKSVQTISESGE